MVTVEKNVRDIATIDAEIAATKEALANVKGSETEVYARIVGYYRSVRNWNKGKRNEYDHRKMFQYDGTDSHTEAINNSTKNLSQEQYRLTNADNSCDCGKAVNVTGNTTDAAVVIDTTDSSDNSKGITSYEFFARNTCPNCPPVKNYLEQLDMAGKRVDVDTDEGLARAAEMGVCAAPTVVFFDANHNEVTRAHNAQELASIFEPVIC